MTSLAIQLAKECWHAIVRMPTSETTSELYPAPASAKEIERFYARAKAQALRDAAWVCDNLDQEYYYDGTEKNMSYVCAEKFRRMAEELERKA